MSFVKRYWAPLLAAGLIPLLLVLAFLQLSWIGEMGERERFRLTQGLYAAAGHLSSAFENEIGVLPAVFGNEREDVEESIRSNDWTNFKKRWEIWKAYAIDPSFVAGFHIVRPRDENQTAKYGNVIRRESGKLTDMIDSLLVYARVGTGLPRKNETLDLGSLALRALEYRQEELIAADFTLESDIAEGIYVKGDPSALELAVGNLISNAAKHAASGRYLGIRLRKQEAKDGDKKANHGWAVLSVKDRGPGIPRNERRLIFDSFYRGEHARKQQTPGSGLGLNLVSRIVGAHGGTIVLDTQAERGSTFILRLPLEDRPHE